MEVIYERCCGIDVHKKMLAVCLFNGRQKEIRNFGTMTEDVLEMVKWLKEADCYGKHRCILETDIQPAGRGGNAVNCCKCTAHQISTRS